jgi:hypothetical protein
VNGRRLYRTADVLWRDRRAAQSLHHFCLELYFLSSYNFPSFSHPGDQIIASMQINNAPVVKQTLFRHVGHNTILDMNFSLTQQTPRVNA